MTIKKFLKLKVIIIILMNVISVKLQSELFSDGEDMKYFNEIQNMYSTKINNFNQTLHFVGINNKTTTLVFHESNITVIPFNFFNSLKKSVSRIFMDFARLEKIENGSFVGADNILEFYARGNIIKELPNGAFFGAFNLSRISLKANLIKNVNDLAFDSIRQLVFLDLSQNLLKTFSFVTTIGGTLKYLNLNSNKIDMIPENSFANVTALRKLRLNYNLIFKLSNDSFGGLKQNASVQLLENICINATIRIGDDSWENLLSTCMDVPDDDNTKLNIDNSTFYDMIDCPKITENSTTEINEENANVTTMKSTIDKLNKTISDLIVKNFNLTKTLCKNLNSSNAFTDLRQRLIKLNVTLDNCVSNITNLNSMFQEKLKLVKDENLKLQQQQSSIIKTLILHCLTFLIGVLIALLLAHVHYKRTQPSRSYLLSQMYDDHEI